MTTQTRQNNDTALPAHELGIYMEEDWKMNKRIRLNAGVHLGLYTIDGKRTLLWSPVFQSFPDQSATQPQSLLYPDEPICTSSQ